MYRIFRGYLFHLHEKKGVNIIAFVRFFMIKSFFAFVTFQWKANVSPTRFLQSINVPSEA